MSAHFPRRFICRTVTSNYVPLPAVTLTAD